MSTISILTEDNRLALQESAEARKMRLQREAADVAEARAQALAGRVVDSAKVKAWIDSIGTDQELPLPTSGV